MPRPRVVLTYTVASPRGDVEVQGVQLYKGVFAARDRGKAGFALDHLPTGRSCGRAWKSLEQAHAVARALVDLMGMPALREKDVDAFQTSAAWQSAFGTLQRAEAESRTPVADLKGWPLRSPPPEFKP